LTLQSNAEDVEWSLILKVLPRVVDLEVAEEESGNGP
jgi:hypothetical protein